MTGWAQIVLDSWPAIRLSLALAVATTVVLMAVGLPLAWWLATTRIPVLRPVVESLTAMPLVLPSTALGFYVLASLGPGTPIGGAWLSLTGTELTLSFTGLLAALCLYSLPFAVQPMQSAFAGVPLSRLEAARTLGAARRDAFRTIALPAARRGVRASAALVFAHTLGAFGVVLVVGGNVAGRTRVVAIEIFEAVERLDYATAHALSAALLVFAFAVLLAVHAVNGRGARVLG